MSITRLILVVFLGLLPFTVASAEGLTPLDVAKIRWAGQVKVSPDGHYLVYTVSKPKVPGEPGFKSTVPDPEIHLYNLKTKTDRVLISGDEKLRGLTWLAGSRTLAFLTKRKGDDKTTLYTLAADGGEAVRRLSFKRDIEGFSVAPDGRRVAFLARDEKPQATDLREKMGFDQEIFEEDWLSSRVYLGKLDAITDDLKPLPVDGHISSVSFSPKPGDDRLCVVTAPNPGVDASLVYQSVKVVDLKGSVLTTVSRQGKLGAVRWSPDGSLLAFTAGVDQHDPDDGSLMVADGRSGQVKNLTAGFSGRVDDFSWKSTKELVLVVSIGCDSKLELLGVDSKMKELPFSSDLNFVEVDVARDGTVVTSADSSAFPQEVFVQGQRITHSNPWLKTKTLSKQEVVTYTARDGLKIEGVLIHPVGVTGAAPTIMVVHGGPESHVSDGWVTGYSTLGQLAANRGYAVFYPNYRGSTGRGLDFSKSSQGDPAGKEFDDLIDAIDYLVARGITDKAKVGITGGSYGGYATAWCSTRYSDRFAAGVMFVGISDKISKVGTTDIPDEEYLVHARKRPWEDWAFFAERSPLRHIESAHTPLLILHGKDDPRVHPTQSLELYRYLKLVGKAPVRLVFYPGEGHGNRKAAARYDYTLRVMQWFDTYLKGKGGTKPAPELDYAL